MKRTLGRYYQDEKKRVLEKCVECGACAKNCPSDAITLTPGVGCASYIIQTWIKGKGAAVECC